MIGDVYLDQTTNATTTATASTSDPTTNLVIKIKEDDSSKLIKIKNKIIKILEVINTTNNIYSTVKLTTEFNYLNIYGFKCQSELTIFAKKLIEEKVINFSQIKSKIDDIKRPSYRYLLIGLNEYLSNNSANSTIIHAIKTIAMAQGLVNFNEDWLQIGPNDGQNMIIYIRNEQLNNVLVNLDHLRTSNTFEVIKLFRYKSLKICDLCVNVGHCREECVASVRVCYKCLGRHEMVNCHLGLNKYNCRFCTSRYDRRDISKINHKTGHILCENLIKKIVGRKFQPGSFRNDGE